MGSKTLPVCAERRQPPLGKGAFEWTESSVPAGVKVNFKSCKRADEGIGPYKFYFRNLQISCIVEYYPFNVCFAFISASRSA